MSGLMHPAWHSSDVSAWQMWWRSTPKDDLVSQSIAPQKGTPMSEPAAIVLALAEALRGTGYVSPNPVVGCVVLSQDNKFLSSGAHLSVGESHAEVNAIKQLGIEETRGATVYVTLEPCAHYGRTPPCANMLASMPIGEVKYLVSDPNPKVNGAGAKLIADAGIKVQHLTEWSEFSEDLTETFLNEQRHQRVFVGLKLASTKSGIYALQNSSRAWITGERSREYGHYLRMRYDGILVGSQTVALDAPTLNVRHPKITGRTPWRFVLDPSGRTLLADKQPLLAGTAGKVVWFIGKDRVIQPIERASFPTSLQIVSLPRNLAGTFDWNDILKAVCEIGCRSLLIEGGAGVWESAAKAGVVDKIHWFAAPDRDDLANGLKWNLSSWYSLSTLGGPSLFQLGQDEYFEFNVGKST